MNEDGSSNGSTPSPFASEALFIAIQLHKKLTEAMATANKATTPITTTATTAATATNATNEAKTAAEQGRTNVLRQMHKHKKSAQQLQQRPQQQK